jgi:hypothetical protein
MLPCPNLIYECPYCGNRLKRKSLASGNTLGAKLYSDGKQIAPMLPDFPNLTKCKKCDNIFYVNDLKKLEVILNGFIVVILMKNSKQTT